MEVRWKRLKRLLFAFCTLLLVLTADTIAQPVMAYTIKQGRMYIHIPRPVTEAALDSFILQFDLGDLELKSFLKSNNPKTLSQFGWKVDVNNEVGLIISKTMEPYKGSGKLDEKFLFRNSTEPLFPAVNNGLTYGVNHFRKKQPFLVQDSVVHFFLRDHQYADRVVLAGSFNNWVPDQLSMRRTDSGWIYPVKLGPGKYWYKFIVDGHWIVDGDNLLSENDGRGNINSVFFRPNTVFTLPGFTDAKKVFLAGSFNGWKRDGLPMQRTATGWELPVYMAEGTHTYKFIVDGTCYADPLNKETVPDGAGGVNAVFRRGQPHLFRLEGFLDAKEVMLVGSFNQWRDFEWRMQKGDTGWEIPFTLGPGNYEYKFKVDGRYISDPANPVTSSASGSSYLIRAPNYLFRLKGFPEARKVYLAGNFNRWDPASFAMKREGDSWIFPVHLTAGKHLYKFIVDGKWIIDPANKLWEQNEHGTGNSVLWIEK